MLNQTFGNKLWNYSVAAGTFLALTPVGSLGQVVYTDVDPDEVIEPGEFYELDLNNDGNHEFVLSNFSATFPSFFYVSPDLTPDALVREGLIKPVGPHSVAGNYPLLLYPYQLPNSYLIGYDLNFHVQTGHFFYRLFAIDYPAVSSLYLVSDEGNFLVETEGFVPLTMQLDGNLHFGWLRLAVNEDYHLVVKDYAYESMAEVPILTPDTTTGILHEGISTLMEPSLWMYEGGILVSLDNVTSAATLKIFDIMGREVYQTDVVSQGVQMLRTNLTPGVYMVGLFWDNQKFVKKIFL